MHNVPVMPIAFSSGAAPPYGQAKTPGGSEPAAAFDKRVVIVDDEMMVAWSLETTVEDMGYQVAGIFRSADDVLAGLPTLSVDLVLMDINLGGGMDGVEAACRIKAAIDVPVIFISAYADLAVRRRIERTLPGTLLLRKPVQQAELGEAIASALAPRN